MALEGNLCPYQCSLGWDLPSFGVFDAGMSLDYLYPFTSDFCSDSGYLEDALGIKWSSRFKRRRMLPYTTSSADSLLLPEFSKSSGNKFGDPFENSSFQRQKSVNPDDDGPTSGLKKLVFLDDHSSLDWFLSEKITNECTPSPKPNPGGHKDQDNSYSSLQVMTNSAVITKDPHHAKVALLSKGGETNNKKVVYPFDMVKPGGIEGDVTLNDINKRLLMRPTRPVRHPVGDSACRPFVLTNGFGPSGKAVATLTRIHTQGRGSVTIIRTRG